MSQSEWQDEFVAWNDFIENILDRFSSTKLKIEWNAKWGPDRWMAFIYMHCIHFEIGSIGSNAFNRVPLRNFSLCSTTQKIVPLFFQNHCSPRSHSIHQWRLISYRSISECWPNTILWRKTNGKICAAIQIVFAQNETEKPNIDWSNLLFFFFFRGEASSLISSKEHDFHVSLHR